MATSTPTSVAPSAGAAERPGAERVAVQRYPTDLVRVALALAVLGIGFLLAQRGELSGFELNLFRLINELPAIVYPVVWVVMQLGNVVAVPAVAALAALTRRWRAARDLLVSALLAYVAADWVKGLVGRERPAGFDVDAVLRDGTVSGIGFISGHSAVAAALAAAAVPYLSRRGRRAVWALAWTVALARVYVGAHLPLDVVGGVAAGWAIGSLVHWVLGVPRWDPAPERVAAALQGFGLPVRELRPASVRIRSSHPFSAVDGSGRRLYVKVLDPDRFERDWLYRLYRVLVVRDLKDADAMAPLGQQAEHEAVASMTARERGVRTPAVLLARGGDLGAVVVQDEIVARPLDELSDAELTPELLTEVWQQVALMHTARIAHHDLEASSVLVDGDGRPWIVDFGNAETGADDDQLAQDVAELMASLAPHSGPDRVVATAVAGLGADRVGEALPGLAPLRLSRATRTGVRAGQVRLGDLRRALRAEVGLPDPRRAELRRPSVAARLAVGAGAALALVGVPAIGGVGAVAQAVGAGGWRWIGGAVALAFLGRVAGAALTATVSLDRRLAVGRTFVASLVADGSSLLGGRPGRRAAATRFLERTGVPHDRVASAVDRFALAWLLAAVLVAAGAFVLAMVEGAVAGWRVPEAVVPAATVGLVAWVLVLVGRWLARPRPGAGARTAAARLRAVRRGAGTPGPAGRPVAARWVAWLGWAALGIGLEGAALAAALHGVGGQVAMLTTAALYAALHLVWTALPVTAAPGAADVVLLLALSAAGAPLADACAAVVVFRVLTYWGPAASGALLSRRLERRLLL
jgi:glycosyltransferase 2 family protein